MWWKGLWDAAEVQHSLHSTQAVQVSHAVSTSLPIKTLDL